MVKFSIYLNRHVFVMIFVLYYSGSTDRRFSCTLGLVRLAGKNVICALKDLVRQTNAAFGITDYIRR